MDPGSESMADDAQPAGDSERDPDRSLDRRLHPEQDAVPRREAPSSFTAASTVSLATDADTPMQGTSTSTYVGQSGGEHRHVSAVGGTAAPFDRQSAAYDPATVRQQVYVTEETVRNEVAPQLPQTSSAVMHPPSYGLPPADVFAPSYHWPQVPMPYSAYPYPTTPQPMWYPSPAYPSFQGPHPPPSMLYPGYGYHPQPYVPPVPGYAGMWNFGGPARVDSAPPFQPTGDRRLSGNPTHLSQTDQNSALRGATYTLTGMPPYSAAPGHSAPLQPRDTNFGAPPSPRANPLQFFHPERSRQSVSNTSDPGDGSGSPNVPRGRPLGSLAQRLQGPQMTVAGEALLDGYEAPAQERKHRPSRTATYERDSAGNKIFKCYLPDPAATSSYHDQPGGGEPRAEASFEFSEPPSRSMSLQSLDTDSRSDSPAATGPSEPAVPENVPSETRATTDQPRTTLARSATAPADLPSLPLRRSARPRSAVVMEESDDEEDDDDDEPYGGRSSRRRRGRR
ncbi:hypothetical protein HDU93_004529 [Gonapodya sp. JEL0774]|nr:hypothetical protein HDU93_004529 [Gonapodya sp. JEL0774]